MLWSYYGDKIFLPPLHEPRKIFGNFGFDFHKRTCLYTPTIMLKHVSYLKLTLLFSNFAYFKHVFCFWSYHFKIILSSLEETQKAAFWRPFTFSTAAIRFISELAGDNFKLSSQQQQLKDNGLYGLKSTQPFCSLILHDVMIDVMMIAF